MFIDIFEDLVVGFVDLVMRTVDILEFKCEEVVGFIRDL